MYTFRNILRFETQPFWRITCNIFLLRDCYMPWIHFWREGGGEWFYLRNYVIFLNNLHGFVHKIVGIRIRTTFIRIRILTKQLRLYTLPLV